MPDTFLNPAVARKYGFYAAVLYAYLQREMKEYRDLNDAANARMGLKWIPGLSYEAIQRELPAFPDVKTVKRAARELVDAGLVLTESTGAFLADHLKTERKRDLATWWHVSKDRVAKKSVPLDYFLESMLLAVDSKELLKHGSSGALILSYWRTQPVEIIEDRQGHRLLSAAEMERKLPLDERTIRRQLKKMVEAGVLVQHSKRKKLYAFTAPVRDLPR